MKVSVPLSLVFGIIATKIHLIRANELVVFYSLGATKEKIIKPFLKVSITIIFFYILLFLTPFAYNKQKALSIKNNSYFTSITNDIFIKYNDYYIYMQQLFPFQKVAIGLIVFELKNNNLKRIIKSQSASFKNNKWQLNEGNIVTLSEVKDINSKGLKTSNFKTYSLLEGFEPSILNKVYEGKTSYSIIDAIRAINLLSKQNINTNKIKSSLFSMILLPFFAPAMVVIIFFFVPISMRFFNIAMFSSIAVFATLGVWGILFALATLSQNNTLNAFFGIILPIFILFTISFYMYKKFA
jgi:lipopolysaccharide export system permease protein